MSTGCDLDQGATRAVLSTDTTAEAEDAQVRRWREKSGVEKLRLVTALSQAADTLACAGIRQRHPAAPPRECFLRLAILEPGSDLACRAYPEIASLADRDGLSRGPTPEAAVVSSGWRSV